MAAVSKKDRFGERTARFVYRNAGWILVTIGLICTAAYPFARKVQLHANFVELLPKNTASVLNLKEMTRHVGGTSFLICVIESPDEKTAQGVTEQFVKRAESFSGIDYVDNRTHIPAFENRKLLFLNLESIQKIKKDIQDLTGYYRRKANPFFVDLLGEEAPKIDVSSYELEHKVYRIGGFEAKDKQSFMRVILIKPSHTVGDFDKSHALFDEATQTFNDIKQGFSEPVTFGLTGPYKTREGEYRTITSDLRFTGLLTMTLIVVVLLVAYRNLRCLLYSLLPLGAGILLTLAFTQVSIGYLNMITAFLFSILLGMGSDYTQHILVNLEEDFRTQKSAFKALRKMYRELWSPLLSSLLTTAVAFFAMTISQFEGFRHFGIIAGFGIIFSFGVIFYGLPSLMVLGQKYFPAQKHLPSKPRVLTKTWVNTFLIAGVIFSIFSLGQLPKSHFNYDFLDLQAKGDDTIQLAERIGHHFGVQLNPVGFMTPDRKKADEIVAWLNTYIATHPETTFDFAASLSSHVPQNQEAKIQILREIDSMLEKREAILAKLPEAEKTTLNELRRQLKATPLVIEDLPEGLKRQYEGSDQAISTAFVYPNDRVVDGRFTMRFVNELRSLDFGSEVKLAGDPIIFADVLFLLEKDAPVVLAVSFIMVVALLFLHFRRADHVLWVLAPVLIGFLWMAGFAGSIHLNYNFINLAILPSILGVGIDSGIYIFDRYRQKRNENFFVSMQKTSRGVVLSALTSIAAFSSLALAKHQGMASLGMLGLIGFLSCLLTSVYFVPALIEFFEFRKQHLFNRTKLN